MNLNVTWVVFSGACILAHIICLAALTMPVSLVIAHAVMLGVHAAIIGAEVSG